MKRRRLLPKTATIDGSDIRMWVDNELSAPSIKIFTIVIVRDDESVSVCEDGIPNVIAYGIGTSIKDAHDLAWGQFMKVLDERISPE